MELRLIDAQQILDVDFGRWLIPFIKTNLIANYSNYSFVNWETFLNETEDIKRLYNKKYRVFDILKFASNNLICDGIAGEVHIHFNNNIYVPGFDRWKLTSAIKTINFVQHFFVIINILLAYHKYIALRLTKKQETASAMTFSTAPSSSFTAIRIA